MDIHAGNYLIKILQSKGFVTQISNLQLILKVHLSYFESYWFSFRAYIGTYNVFLNLDFVYIMI